MLKVQAILIATAFLSGIVSAAPATSIQARENFNVDSRFILTKRVGSIHDIKRDLTATLAADKAKVIVDDAEVAVDTGSNNAAALKDATDTATLNADKAIAAPLDAITSAALIAKMNAESALNAATANLKATGQAAVNANIVVNANYAIYTASSGPVAANTNTLQQTLFALKFTQPYAQSSSPFGGNSPVQSATDILIAAQNDYAGNYLYSPAPAQKMYDSAVTSALTNLNSAIQAEKTAPASDYTTRLADDEAAFSALKASMQSQIDATLNLYSSIDANTAANVLSDAAGVVSNAAALALTTASNAYITANGASYSVDLPIASDAALKATDDAASALTLSKLATDTATDVTDKAKVVADQAAITLANAPKTLADAADALAVTTLATTSAALTALNSAQASLKTDTASSASAIQVLQSPLDAVSNFLALATIAFANAGTAATLAVTNQANSQTAYNNALAQSTKSTKTYNDALNVANAMIHGGAKNAAITATTPLKTASVSDTILTATAAFNLALAKQANLAAIATVTGTTTALAFETAKFKVANGNMITAKSQITADTAALTTLTTTYNSAKAASDLAVVKKTAADLAYKCSLGPC